MKPLCSTKSSCDCIAAGDVPEVKSGRRLISLQWLRAAAALLVLAEHVKNEIATVYFGLYPPDSPLAVFPFSAGVDIFFVISGFVMAYSSRSLYGQRHAPWRFFVRRLARLVPLYWLTTTALLVLFFLVGGSGWEGETIPHILLSYGFVPAPNSSGALLPVLAVGWTLNYEMAFYLLFAVFVGLRERLALAGVCLSLLALVKTGVISDPMTPVIQFWTNSIILEFAAGILLYILFRNGLRLNAPVRIGLTVGALVMLAYNIAPVDLEYHRWYLWGCPAAMIVLAAISGPPRLGTHWSDVSGDLAGQLSYSIYLVHLLAIVFVSKAMRVFYPDAAILWFSLFPLGVLGLSLTAALVLHRTIELPVLRLAQRLTGMRVTKGPGAPPAP